MPDHPASTKPSRVDKIAVFFGTVKSFIAVVIGIVLILAGIPLAIITPFPFVPIGAAVIVTGMAIIARNSRTARSFASGVLRRNPSLSARMPIWLKRLFLGCQETDSRAAEDMNT